MKYMFNKFVSNPSCNKKESLKSLGLIMAHIFTSSANNSTVRPEPTMSTISLLL